MRVAQDMIGTCCTCRAPWKSSTLTACFIDCSWTCLTRLHHFVPRHFRRLESGDLPVLLRQEDHCLAIWLNRLLSSRGDAMRTEYLLIQRVGNIRHGRELVRVARHHQVISDESVSLAELGCTPSCHKARTTANETSIRNAKNWEPGSAVGTSPILEHRRVSQGISLPTVPVTSVEILFMKPPVTASPGINGSSIRRDNAQKPS